jgi:uncharacterized membrane protein YeaQ/YmgE (transglycosylase-associated protein family)
MAAPGDYGVNVDKQEQGERNATSDRPLGRNRRRHMPAGFHECGSRDQRGVWQPGGMVMLESIIVWLVVGAIAGWLAGQIVKGYGFGLVGNIVVGIVGAFIAGWLLPRIGFVLVGGILAAIVNAVIGAVILLIVVGFFKK